jgi:prepilin-type N-terminal cleavage/methylation domain-containing protein
VFKTLRKGFTLIELLIVIAIVAVLAAVVVLTLNPAELLKQARDSNRLNDITTLKNAISLYLSDVSTPALTTTTGAGVVQASGPTCYVSTTSTGMATQCGGYFGATYLTVASGSGVPVRLVDGTGWIPVNFNAMTTNPLSNLPVDPTNSATYYYSYAASSTNTTFELDTKMESQKYASSSSNVVSTDGGNNASVYEGGNSPGLIL